MTTVIAHVGRSNWIRLAGHSIDRNLAVLHFYSQKFAYDYKVGDKILVLSGGMDPKLQLHQGPYTVLAFNKTNGTLHIKRRNYAEPINIRLVRPYFGANRRSNGTS